MYATPFAIAKTEKLDAGRELITYASDGYVGSALTAITHTEEGAVTRVDLFFWRVTDPLQGHGLRDRVCDVDLDYRYGTKRWEAKMSGPSFAFDDMASAQAFAGALQVAAAWFSLAKAEADHRNRS